ncbi:cell wall protein RTB1 isoform X2 [Drosophila obscura]|uniref:cell wall protein RTB1 isoform X2 n=1 Tax=Drosophila obscura TaxID=7282 RepID=UPI001BB23877|nr:cell wall protein RTB1 isoform X2 [Drosophila obscura]
MKFALALCLLLAASCSAMLPKHPADLASMLSHQQFAMSRMISTFDTRADDSLLVNDCFNSYLDDQREVIVNYNQRYNGCINTAQASRDIVTAESASERQNLQDRTNAMCTGLTSCDELVDGLKFFECYRDSSSDSYKTTFTLNSDSNLDFNRISASYSVIETDLTDCVDTARVDYAHDMDTCDEQLTVCLAGGVVPTDAPVTNAPSTAAPLTDAPSTAAPVTDAPSTAAPVTDAPSTAAPVTDAPSTAAPVTDAPSTAAPVTDAPSTAAPVTDAPSTAAPITDAPSTDETEAPISTVVPTNVPVTEESPNAPEEDLSRALPKAHQGAWSLFKRFF